MGEKQIHSLKTYR